MVQYMKELLQASIGLMLMYINMKGHMTLYVYNYSKKGKMDQ